MSFQRHCINSSYVTLNENHIGEPTVIAEDFVWINAHLSDLAH